MFSGCQIFSDASYLLSGRGIDIIIAVFFYKILDTDPVQPYKDRGGGGCPLLKKSSNDPYRKLFEFFPTFFVADI